MYKTASKVKTYLSAQLPAQLTTIGTEEGITIPTWEYMETYESDTNASPRIFILPGSWQTLYGDTEGPHPVGFDEMDLRVLIEIEGNDPEEIQKYLLCYREAIKRIVEDDFTFWGALNRVLLGDGDPSPLGEYRDRREFIQAIEQILVCRENL